MDKHDPKAKDPIGEGAHARAIGRPKDACPYPAGSSERSAWLEGYDGTPARDAAAAATTDRQRGQ